MDSADVLSYIGYLDIHAQEGTLISATAAGRKNRPIQTFNEDCQRNSYIGLKLSHTDDVYNFFLTFRKHECFTPSEK
ncbi:hypothetical protein HUJ04_006538 [Dendroctonus ponderosae]|nr:hypothetical protein HUJ04_006538 [Dendroctonus ponderosae]